MRIIETERIPIKLWLDDIEDGAVEQAKNVANLPFTYDHVAIMPDAHFGVGVSIGTVFASDSVIIPNAVGVDIGCGMCAARTPYKYIPIEQIKEIMGKIRELIPVGFEHRKEPGALDLLPKNQPDDPILNAEYKSSLTQLGTLGGGNHFIEIQKDSEGYIWVMIHSGSRNLGLKVAQYYNDIAEKQHHSEVNLAHLDLNTSYADSYIAAMNYCVEFALVNRKLMMFNAMHAFREVLGGFDTMDFHNIAHNYAVIEDHFGKSVYVHRKGATSAKQGQIGIIPGSQGTKSYIVCGKGNKDSFESCSHGAGRTLSRTAARNNLNLEEEIENLNKKGIVHAIRRKQDLDEAPSAYKDIDVVMRNQIDLVDIVKELTPVAVIKG